MAAPTLVHSVQLRSTLLRIVQTPCIITKPPPSSSTPLSLVVPTNPFLTSTTKFPYFSTGGPSQHKFESPRQHQADWAPPGFVSNWGGMEIGGGMRYSSQTVDGLVCLHGGKEYQQSLQDMRDSSSTSPHALDEGTSDSPPTAKFLTCPAPPKITSLGYDHLIHLAVPPSSSPPNHLLRVISWALSSSPPSTTTNAPLIGAGCRGWDVTSATTAFLDAVKAVDKTKISATQTTPNTINLCVMDLEIADTIKSIASSKI
ncbi:hypothetical protein TrLO_g3020 [Triparma laevis f. longispina]|uniref:Macro domain-containing protein n=1 Tax=Triparma laevis f. longispina TaxID=1714387 RepID=A0A9W7E9J3_9STRA|nr:hypothetical protein TrLO_g3020 [Triparma laevis f. longispina]